MESTAGSCGRWFLRCLPRPREWRAEPERHQAPKPRLWRSSNVTEGRSSREDEPRWNLCGRPAVQHRNVKSGGRKT